MTPTEKTRRLLDECGVRWWEATPNKTKWNSPVLGGMVAVSEWNGKLVLDAGYINVTPEQAIAATLGRGTLTADDVRDLIERHSYASGGNGRDFHNGAYVAIADELDALTLGRGTCHKVLDFDGAAWICSECGEHIGPRRWNFCPNCGRRYVG